MKTKITTTEELKGTIDCLKELSKITDKLGIAIPSSSKLNYFKDDGIKDFISFMEKHKKECDKIIDRNFKEKTEEEKDALRRIYPFLNLLLEVTYYDEKTLLTMLRIIHQNYDNVMQFLSSIINKNNLEKEITFENAEPYIIYDLIKTYIKDFTIIDKVNSLIINDNGKYYMVKKSNSEKQIPLEFYRVISTSDLSFSKVGHRDNIIVTTETEEKNMRHQCDNSGEEANYQIINAGLYESHKPFPTNDLLISLEKLVERIPKSLFENSNIVALQDDEYKRIYILKNKDKIDINHIDSNGFKYIQNGLINVSLSNNMVTEDDKNIMIIL